MRLNDAYIEKIMKKAKPVADALEEYDLTHKWPIGRERIDVTLSRRTITKLKSLRDKQGKPISRIIEEALDKL